MIYSETYKYVYYCIPKTASQTLEAVLKEHFDGHTYNTSHDCFLPDAYKDYFKFCTIRNPYTRALSGYRYVKPYCVGNPFDCFHLCSMNKFLDYAPLSNDIINAGELFTKYASFGKPVVIDWYLEMEHLEEVFHRLPWVDKRVPIPKLNESTLEVSEAEKAEIAVQCLSYHAEDFRRFGYAI